VCTSEKALLHVRLTACAPCLRSMQTTPRIPDDEGADESRPSLDLPGLAGGAKGTGPRLFCGHVPKVCHCVQLSIIALLS
jgi:hypothetical protein